MKLNAKQYDRDGCEYSGLHKSPVSLPEIPPILVIGCGKPGFIAEPEY